MKPVGPPRPRYRQSRDDRFGAPRGAILRECAPTRGARNTQSLRHPVRSPGAPSDRARRRRPEPSCPEPEGQRLEVSAFGKLRVLRVIRSRKPGSQKLRRPPCAPDAPDAGRAELGQIGGVTAGAQRQRAALLDQRRGQSRDLFIGAEPRIQRLFRGCESRRVADHGSETPPLVVERLKRVESVRGPRLEPVAEAAGRGREPDA